MYQFTKKVLFKLLWGACYIMNVLDKSGILKVIILVLFIQFCEPFYRDYLAKVGNDPSVKLNLILFGFVVGMITEKAHASLPKGEAQ